MLTSSTILAIIVVLTIGGYVFDQALELINLRNQHADIPQEVQEFYDRDKYNKAISYHRDRTKFGFVTSAFAIVLSLAMLLAGGYGLLDGVLRAYIQHEIVLALAFFATIGIAGDILTIPFQLYGTFVLEARYGFNNTTVKTFIADKLKGYVLAAIIGGALLSALIFLVEKIGPSFWIWFSLIAAAFVLLANMFYTTLIVPLFNKLTPLPEGELKAAINNFARKVSFPLDNIFVIDGSKRSSKANAFFAGIGRKKKIVLYDTLIANHSTAELVAVLAHEVGHFKKKHIVWSYLLSVVQIVFTLWVLSTMVYSTEVSQALGGAVRAVHLNLLAFGILFSPISGITGLLMNIFSRRNEFEADAYARDTYDAEALATALKRLSVDSLSNLYPHPLYVFFHYSHPPLLRRLHALAQPASS